MTLRILVLVSQVVVRGRSSDVFVIPVALYVVITARGHLSRKYGKHLFSRLRVTNSQVWIRYKEVVHKGYKKIIRLRTRRIIQITPQHFMAPCRSQIQSLGKGNRSYSFIRATPHRGLGYKKAKVLGRVEGATISGPRPQREYLVFLFRQWYERPDSLIFTVGDESHPLAMLCPN